MPNLSITQTVETGDWVTSGHFGGNAVYTRNTVDGRPDDTFVEAVNELDIQTLRYPAGQPDVAYIDGMVIDGALPNHLIEFLEAARENGHQVVIVTPTHAAYRGPSEVEEFVGLLMETYSDVVHAFEVGNEYWNHQDEYSYGEVADESVVAIDQALDLLGLDVPIWTQMGDAGGQMSAFHNTEDTWGWRNINANQAILDQLSPEARDAIDGVVEHYYFRLTSRMIDDLSAADQLIGLDYSIWQNALGEDISLNITEWNIRTSNYFQLGMRAASTMIAQFEFLISLDVDEMYVWPPQHNTSSDLAGGGSVLYDDITGLVINSVGGAVFDLMSSSLVGMESIAVATTQDSSELNTHVYANENEVVVYVASRSNEIQNVSFNLGEFWPGAIITSAIQVGYDQSSSDGIYYHYSERRWAEAETITINGEEYVLNEHDVNAEITQHVVEDLVVGQNAVFDLLPYEIIELTYELPATVISGTNQVDRLSGTNFGEFIFAFADDDVVTAGSGADTIDAGFGDDFINAGDGHDVVQGGDGQDTLRGWGGADTLSGEGGEDSIYGWFGNDRLIGGGASDLLDGGADNDTLSGGEGDDILTAGDGNDLASGGVGNDFVSGEAGRDTLSGGAGQDRIEGGDGRDRLSGGSGNDTLIGGNENDLLVGDSGADQLHGNEGNDTIIGGGDNDVVFGGGGADRLVGGEGRDNLYGQGGTDYITGGDGNDLVSGGDDNDVLFGGSGNDTIFGGDGEDRAWGGGGNDLLIGGTGNDRLDGGMGDDNIRGDSGSDTLIGNSGNDLLNGSDGDDLISGGSGDDNLLGGTGSDTLIGGGDHDTIEGGDGADYLRGSAGFDVFVFSDGHGHDTVGDFHSDSHLEQIDLAGVFTIDSLEALLAASSQIGADVLIQTSTDSSILLENVELADLDQSDFIF